MGVDRATAFLRAAHEEGAPDAVSFINEDLDRGVQLEAILSDPANGYSLTAKGRGRRFVVEFGCSPGPLVGDGGTWTVEFDECGAVTRLEPDSQWIS